ncbi:hypothetical protein RZS08_40820, partial [Arthrospira platensis SPKY1]|nr:hypothetical protein [Arthrospira platensis SPKY1]
MKAQAKLETIALACDLSASTVSRILNGKTKNSRHTKKVFEVATRLGYLQPGMAAFDSSRPSYTLIAHFALGEFYTSLIYGFNRAAEDLKIRLFTYRIPEQDTGVVNLLEELAASGMQGAILLLPELQVRDYQRIVQEKPEAFPVVSISPMAIPVIHTVVFDSYSAGYQVAEYFIQKGYTRMGIVKGPTNRS